VQRARPGVTDVLRPMAFFLLIAGSAACGAPSTPLPSAPPDTLAPATLPASLAVTLAPSEEPSASASIPATPSSVPPTETASPNITPTPTPGGPDGTAAACSGSSQTKDFFTAIAEAVQWPVYCATLPTGWSVDRGSGNTYALANGGRMVIGYHSNAGLHLELREGHWCTDSANACSPHDQDLGPIALGDLQGELMTLGSGGFAVYVDPGQSPSWTITGTGMDEGAFRNLVGALALVRA
jgi:hypothetical protein